MQHNMEKPGNIMIIDDTPANLRLLDTMLSNEGYHIYAFTMVDMAYTAAWKNPPDLILMDINMPEINGYQACHIFKNNPQLKDIPIIFISALNDPVNKVRAFRMGGVDYINKPFQFEEVLARIQTHLKIYQMQSQLSEANHRLEELVSEQVREIADSQMATIMALARLAQSRDDNTGRHLERVYSFSRVLTQRLQATDLYADRLNDSTVECIPYACFLHDIGKVAIPDSILLKPGKLTPQEFAIMKTHAQIGAETLQTVFNRYPGNKLIQIGIAVARWHHERWDGSGYPDGLAGDEIPLEARLMSLVDVYDALRSERPYKGSISHEETRAIILACSGSQLDPAVVQAFLDVEAEFARIFTCLGGEAD